MENYIYDENLRKNLNFDAVFLETNINADEDFNLSADAINGSNSFSSETKSIKDLYIFFEIQKETH
jgi:hypothetical protein